MRDIARQVGTSRGTVPQWAIAAAAPAPSCCRRASLRPLDDDRQRWRSAAGGQRGRSGGHRDSRLHRLLLPALLGCVNKCGITLPASRDICSLTRALGHRDHPGVGIQCRLRLDDRLADGNLRSETPAPRGPAQFGFRQTCTPVKAGLFCGRHASQDRMLCLAAGPRCPAAELGDC